MNKSLERCRGYRRLTLAGLFVVALGLTQICISTEPAWWGARGVKSTAPASDYAIANQGQAKWFALKAEEELRFKLPTGFNGPIYTTPLPTGNNYAPINQGQLKALVQQLYLRIQQAKAANPTLPITLPQVLAGTYPWTDTPADDQNYALVNIGQLKYVFSFEFNRDADADNLPDWWEILYGLDPHDATNNNGPSGDPDGDGVSNYIEYLQGRNPTSSGAVTDFNNTFIQLEVY